MSHAEDMANLKQLERDRDVEMVMGSERGRRLLWRIICEWGELFSLSVDVEPRVSALLEGRRAVGLALYREVQRLSPELHARMVAEALEQERLERLAAEATAAE